MYIPVRMWRRTATVLVAFALTVGLAGCLSVRFVSDYDEITDRELSALHSETTEFVDRMIAAQGTPAGTFEQNRDFYSGVDSRLATLVARARSNQAMGSCPSAEALDRTIGAAGLPGDVRERIGTLPEGDCDVTLLGLLRGAYGDLRTLHMAQGAAGLPPSARGPILEGGLGSLLRTAIAVQVAKRSE